MASMQQTFDEWIESIQGEAKASNDGTVNLAQSANESAHEAVEQSQAGGSLQLIREELVSTSQSAGESVKNALDLGGNNK